MNKYQGTISNHGRIIDYTIYADTEDEAIHRIEPFGILIEIHRTNHSFIEYMSTILHKAIVSIGGTIKLLKRK